MMQKVDSSVRRAFPFTMIIVAVLLSACSEPDVILPGKREDIRSVLNDEDALPVVEVAADEARPISLPATAANASWTQGIGSPDTRARHPSLSNAPQPIWSASIGAGDSRRQRITANPVVAGGVIYTLDADALVTATSASGQRVWQQDVKPARDKSGNATGGGLAIKDGTLFVTLGYGSLVALNASTGAEKWRQRLEGTGSGSPTVFGDLVYAVSGDNTGWALRAEDGRIEWQLSASESINNVLGAPAPAVTDDLAIFAFGSGEIQAVFRRGGLRRWDASALGKRAARALGSVGDVTGSPVVSGSKVYIGNQAGRIVALDVKSGARVWTAREGAVGPVLPVGDSVFAISELGELLRMNASDGARVWGTQLPSFVKDKPKRRSEVVAHHGPILAGGRIYIASNDGLIRSFDPASGALVGTTEIPGGATTAPVVAGGVLYVVSAKGQLHAFR